MFIFSEHLDSASKYYVYLHRDSLGNIFYVGKGSKRRAWDTCRNVSWKHRAARGYTVELLYSGLSEEDAYFEEMRLIEKLKSLGTLINKHGGGPLKYGIPYSRFGKDNPFYNKKHSEKTKERLRNFRCSPIVCTNMKTGEVHNVSGTRNAAVLTGLSRPTIMRVLRKNNGYTIKTNTLWRFERCQC